MKNETHFCDERTDKEHPSFRTLQQTPSPCGGLFLVILCTNAPASSVQLSGTKKWEDFFQNSLQKMFKRMQGVLSTPVDESSMGIYSSNQRGLKKF
jgi:hypothetical protein